jgi:methionyl-tRNA synthetase
MNKKFYITCAIPYVNAAPHIGHALEFVQGDVIARYHRLLGEDTLLLSGGDENALKNVQAAEKAGQPVQQFIDTNNTKFFELTKSLGCQFDIWQKGSDTLHHFPSSQNLWERCNKAGDIYKKSYEGLYCVGCETFYEPEELNEQGECFEHPGKKLETVKEENYFFRLSKYQQQLIDLITTDTLAITPDTRKNEVLSFLKQPLRDISISRSNERAKNWGVPVPNDPSQRMYVWFDALNIYQSGIGFGWDEQTYKKWWPADVHVIGKGISRFHAVYWPAFLLSAGLQPPKALFVHGYFTVNGQKMSKTLGNVIDPLELINKYGADPLRYYFLREIPASADGDFSERRFKELYNADLANGLGNLVARIAKLASVAPMLTIPAPRPFQEYLKDNPEYKQHIEAFEFNEALTYLWGKIKTLDIAVNEKKPWEKKGEELTASINFFISPIQEISVLIQLFLPHTGTVICEQFSGSTITAGTPLFPRLT